MKTRKFTDKKLLKHYDMGFSDYKIAKNFGCNHFVVCNRRCKLGLIANFTNFAGKRNNKKELLESYEKHMYKVSKFSKKPETKKRRNKALRRINQSDEGKEKLKKQDKKNYLKYRQRILENKKKYYQKMKELKGGKN